MMEYGDRLFQALTEFQIRQQAKPHLRDLWFDQAREIRNLPETRR